MAKKPADEFDEWLPIEADHFSPDYGSAREVAAKVGGERWVAQKQSVAGRTQVVLLAAETQVAHINAFDLSRANWTDGAAQGQPGVRGAVGTAQFVVQQPDFRGDGRVKALHVRLGDREIEITANGRLLESEKLFALLSGKYAYVATQADRDLLLLSVLLRTVNVAALVSFEKTGMPDFIARKALKAVKFMAAPNVWP
jgi:hypothetical protein